jgi:hypothetical protein
MFLLNRFIFCFFGLGFSLLVSSASAQMPLNVTYALYAGGFNVVDIHGTYDTANEAYAMTMDLETAGLLGRVAPWAGEIKSHGLNRAGGATPLEHSFKSTWRGEVETTTFNFGKDGALKSHIRTENDGKMVDKMPPQDVYADKPVDMLSALFRVMNTQGCENKIPAWDGKRRFDMVFKSQGEGLLKKTKYSAFEGKTEICTVEIKPVAGKWRDNPRGWMSIQGQAKDNGALPKLWFGSVRDDMPPIPVRFQIKTDYGTMIMHLKSFDGQPSL